MARWTIPAVGATETEVSALLAALVTALKPSLVVETGTFLGSTAEVIGAALLTTGGHLYTLEIDSARAMAAEQRLAGLPVTVVCADSLGWTPPGPIDLLFADSEYRDGTRAREIERFRFWASLRCVILTHDTVDQAAREWLEPLVFEAIVHPWCYLPTPYGIGLTRYKEASDA